MTILIKKHYSINKKLYILFLIKSKNFLGYMLWINLFFHLQFKQTIPGED